MTDLIRNSGELAAGMFPAAAPLCCDVLRTERAGVLRRVCGPGFHAALTTVCLQNSDLKEVLMFDRNGPLGLLPEFMIWY